MSIDYVAGDQVVCINVTPMPGISTSVELAKYLTLNAVYTVERVGPHPVHTGYICAMLAGVLTDDGRQIIFLAERFRKVQKKFSGMETLKGLLKIKTKELIDG